MSFVQNCRKIVAIGRNFADHAKELGNAVPTQPMLFLKPPSSFVLSPGKIEIPQNCNVHHELELGVVIGKTGRDINKSEANSHIAGYCLALDMTARNLQDIAKTKGHPWTVAKGYDTFTPVGQFIESSRIKDPMNLNLKLKINDQVRQNGNTKDMIFDIPTLIEHVSKIMTLEKGDVILTGTPAGVGPVFPGEKVVGTLSDDKGLIAEINFTAVSRP